MQHGNGTKTKVKQRVNRESQIAPRKIVSIDV